MLPLSSKDKKLPLPFSTLVLGPTSLSQLSLASPCYSATGVWCSAFCTPSIFLLHKGNTDYAN